MGFRFKKENFGSCDDSPTLVLWNRHLLSLNKMFPIELNIRGLIIRQKKLRQSGLQEEFIKIYSTRNLGVGRSCCQATLLGQNVKTPTTLLFRRLQISWTSEIILSTVMKYMKTCQLAVAESGSINPKQCSKLKSSAKRWNSAKWLEWNCMFIVTK